MPWEDSSVRISIPSFPNIREYLSLYEEWNDWLPRDVRLALAPFALYSWIGRQGVIDLFNINPKTPHRHRPWFYWQCLKILDLGEHWAADEINHSMILPASWWLRVERATDRETEERLLRLLFRTRLSHPGHRKRNHGSGGYREKGDLMRPYLWTKGGGWPTDLKLSHILVLKKHLPRREECWWSVSDEKMHQFEKELMHVCDPDKDRMPDVYFRAIEYTRKRYPQIRGVKRNMSYRWVPWVLQSAIQEPGTLRWWQINRKKHGHLRQMDPTRSKEW